MSIATDVSVSVTGDIRYQGTTANFTVLELHRFLQNLADDASASGGDLVDITSDTPSERSTDNIITLLGNYNIDDDMAEHLYAGSITQASGATVYSGLQVLGAVNNANTQLMIIQDNDIYQYTPTPAAPFWGDQSTGGYNGNAAAGILMRCLIKTREFGADIDGKRIRVQARHWGDTYDFFNVRLGQGESVAAIGTTPDAQNTTSQGTVTAYTHILNSGTIPVNGQDETGYDNSPTTEGTFTPGTGYSNSDVILMSDGTRVTVDSQSGGAVATFTVDSSLSRGAGSGDTLTQTSVSPAGGSGFELILEGDNVQIDPDHPIGGFQLIDLNNGAGPKEYYSQWTFSTNDSSDGLKGMWEFIKDLTGNGTSKTIHASGGELFLGVTHSYPYGSEANGPFLENELIVWGTNITYDTLAGGTFAAGDYVRIGASGAAGRVMWDNGTTNMIVALDDPTITLLDSDVITIADGVGAVTAAINVTILNNSANGGAGILLALDDDGTTGNHYIQLVNGAAPVNALPVRGLVSGATASLTSGPSSKTIPKTFLGSYTGTLIGAYGIGVLPANLTAVDTIQDLASATQIPPNNVTFTVSGLISGEDRVLVGPRSAGILQKDQDTLNGTLTHGVTTSVVMTTAIPVDTPAAGQIRIQDNNGVFTYQPYDSYTGSTYTLTAAYSGSDGADATTGNDVFIAYIDELATAASATFTTVYNNGLGNRNLFVRVRDGGATPIKTFEAPATLGSAGGSVAAIRTSDA